MSNNVRFFLIKNYLQMSQIYADRKSGHQAGLIKNERSSSGPALRDSSSGPYRDARSDWGCSPVRTLRQDMLSCKKYTVGTASRYDRPGAKPGGDLLFCRTVPQYEVALMALDFLVQGQIWKRDSIPLWDWKSQSTIRPGL